MYQSKAKTTKISYASSITLKLRDNFYKVDFSEERELPDNLTDAEIEQERLALCNDVNCLVDKQAEDILETFK